MHRVLCEVFTDLDHKCLASAQTPAFEGSGDRVVPVGALDRSHDVICEEVDDLMDLGWLRWEDHGFVDEADAQLVEHELGELREQFLNDKF